MALEPIRRRGAQDPDRADVERRVIAAVEANPERFLAAYVRHPDSFGGRYVCSDLFKETFSEYAASKEARGRYNGVVHDSAAVLAAEQFRRIITDRSEPARDQAVFLTGIPGAGKTSSFLGAGQLDPAARVVFEGQLVDPVRSVEKIAQAVDQGLKPVIIVVHREPEQALENTLRRFVEKGRGAGIGVMADIQGGLPGSLGTIEQIFGNSVQLRVIDGGDRDNYVQIVGWRAIKTLEKDGTRDDIYRRLEVRLEQLRADRSISADAYRQARGLPPRALDRSMDRADDDSRRADAAGRRLQAGNRQAPLVEAGLSAERDGRALAERFRNSTQAERVKDPELNGAAKVLAHTNGVIDAAFGPETAKAATSRAAAMEKIAGALERGEDFSAPKTMQRVRASKREPERSRDRASTPER